MKTWILLPAAALIGVVIGAWGPREQLRAERRQATEKRAAAPGENGFADFARMVRIPDIAGRHRRPSASTNAVRRVVKPARAAASATNAVAVAALVPAAATNMPPRHAVSPEDLRARIEQAQDLWAARVDLARSQWKAKLKLDAAGMAKFDAAMDEMNERLLDTMQGLADRLAAEEKMTPELSFRLMGDVSTVMAETYEKVGAAVAPEKRALVSEMSVVDFIDPGVAEPLVSVQGKFEGFHALGKGRR